MLTNTLDRAKKGTKITIVKLPAGVIKSQLIRLGISEGDTVKCVERLPGGTIVVQKNRQEIALGFDLAKKIKIILQ
ncbi:MAG: FeoA family protein [Melioribacteraceae bacterium]